MVLLIAAGSQTSQPSHDIRSVLRSSHSCTVVSELSLDLKVALDDYEDLAEAVIQLLNNSEVLFTSPFAASCMVFKISEGIAAKVTSEEYLTTEARNLAYLQEHLPEFSVLKLHGMVRLGTRGVLFTKFIPGIDLEKAWPQLDDSQKRAISSQLDALLVGLRELPFPRNTPLGGVDGQRCKDGRRFIRKSSDPILDAQQFEDFIFSGSRAASAIYIEVLRNLIPKTTSKIVFPHGDIRPANIMVDENENGSWAVVAIIDWYQGGFYPEYWESVKMTNNLSAVELSD